MSFRRIPFQFSTTDPAERQRELEKRFGVPSQNKMYVEAANPLTMGSGYNTNISSPRFQHRVPMFVDGKHSRSSVDSSACENKTPKVRVIPIEIEKDGSPPSTRHRTFSGPADISKQHKDVCPPKDDANTLKRSMEDLSKPSKMKAASGPKVYNIPIKVEQPGVSEKKSKLEKGKKPAMKPHPEVNGCQGSKNVQNVEPEPSPKKAELTEEGRMKIKINDALKKIVSVQEELKSYEIGVNDFNGTAKDKQYRYLDEMLTRCMIKLDDIETMGNEEVRSSRKKVVKMVQACIDLLENKVNAVNNPDTSVNTNNVTSMECIDKQDNAEQSVLEEENETIKNEKCRKEDIPEENQPAVNTNESKLTQNESSVSNAPSLEYKPDVPEVEMVEVTSTASDANQLEKTGFNSSIIDQSQSDSANTISNDIITLPSESNEIEMSEVTTQNNPQDQDELPKPEVSSTNTIHETVFTDSAPITDSNEAEMADVSSTSNNSSEFQSVESIPEVSSSVLQPEPVALNIKDPAEAKTSEHSKILNNVETKETDSNCSNCETSLQSSIPEVEMKEIVEDSCKTINDTLVEDQSNLQSKCISNNNP